MMNFCTGNTILVIGGENEDRKWLSSVEQYDIANDMWQERADLPRATCAL